MKKIQITTVEKTANVEVIELNSSFVAKAVRAADAATKLRNLIDEAVPKVPVLPDEPDPRLVDSKPDYTCPCQIEVLEPEEIVGKLCQFVHELESALLGE